MISVVICTCNRESSLRRTLASLARMIVPAQTEWEVLVVDNNSQDDTRGAVHEIAQNPGLNVRYAFEARQGKSHALNTGIRTARGEIIALTDDDVLVDRLWLWEVEKALHDSGCIGVAGKIIALWDCPKPRWLSEQPPYKLATAVVSFDQGEEPCVLRVAPLGANLSFRKVTFERYGYFRTDLGPRRGTLMTGEDTEFFHRITKSGEQVAYSPKAVVYHPVEKNRIRKQYYRSWSYYDGRGLARREAPPNNTVYYLGIPRYLLRSLGEDAVRWTLSFDSKRRFYYEQRLCQLTGQIVETRKMLRKSGSLGSPRL
jgi:glucosyl-dolichyl phosphate glucuronosyltransferase